MNNIIQKFRGTILGSAIGDALGAPLETKTALEIKNDFPHFDVHGLDYVSTGTRKKGEWTDDTQLMLPIVWSYIYKGKIDPEDIANLYVDIYKNQPLRGWGRSTINSVKNLSNGIHWTESSKDSFGLGNGAAMKAAPFGLILHKAVIENSDKVFFENVKDILFVGVTTHKHIGVIASLLQSFLVLFALNEVSSTKILDELIYIEKSYFNKNDLTNKIGSLLKCNSIEEICQKGGVTSKAEESWPTIAAIYLKFCNNKSACIKALVDLIKQGGDTDTTGAMLGALIGARYTDQIFPQRLFRSLENGENIKKLADNLYKALFTEEPKINNNISIINIIKEYNEFR